jgi:hypothetical protein
MPEGASAEFPVFDAAHDPRLDETNNATDPAAGRFQR